MDNYFKDKGYDVNNILLPSKDSLDELVNSNDSVIITYSFINSDGIGAHFIEAHYDEINKKYLIANYSNYAIDVRKIDSISDLYINDVPETLMLSATILNK